MAAQAIGCALSTLQEGDLEAVRTVRDVTSLLAHPRARARVEGALLGCPAFAADYRQRAAITSASQRDARLPPGSLGALHREFRAWYGLGPNFFPLPFVAEASPIEFAAHVLARDHDLYHVLCAYETSDQDEVALQSFLCGQAPRVFACFVATIERSAKLAAVGFKHLRDLLDQRLDREALARGRAAQSLLTTDLNALLDQPIAIVRRALAIEPRRAERTAQQLRNTCGGRRAGSFFAGRA